MYPDEFYELDPFFGQGEAIGEAVMVAAGIVLVILGVVLLVALLMYVFQSLGLYTIAKRRGIKNPWLAWIPWVAPYWIVGSVSDQYHYVTRGEVKSRRIILLVLAVVSIVLSGMSNAAISSEWIETLEYMVEENADGTNYFVNAFAELSLINVVASVVGVVLYVFWQMSLYDLYQSCDPNTSVVFLVLGILFGFLVPFFIFACRKKDYGMPPRRPEPQTYQDPQPRTYQEPWENV